MFFELHILFFFLVCLFSTTIGAISGIGGGVIIKPAFDMASGLGASLVSFLSGCTVLAMSSFSLLGTKNLEVKVEAKRGTLLAAGGVIGGIFGKMLFDVIRTGADPVFLTIMQNYILCFLTVGVFFYMLHKDKIKGYNIHNPLLCILIGSFLGATGAFLGIGGGPINLIVLYYFFSMDTKLAALTSIYIIFFSQVSSLISVFITGIPEFDPLALGVMIVGGIGGGVLGRKIARKLSAKATDKLFTVVLFGILIICVINITRFTLLLGA